MLWPMAFACIQNLGLTNRFDNKLDLTKLATMTKMLGVDLCITSVVPVAITEFWRGTTSNGVL